MSQRKSPQPSEPVKLTFSATACVPDEALSASSPPHSAPALQGTQEAIELVNNGFHFGLSGRI